MRFSAARADGRAGVRGGVSIGTRLPFSRSSPHSGPTGSAASLPSMLRGQQPPSSSSVIRTFLQGLELMDNDIVLVAKDLPGQRKYSDAKNPAAVCSAPCLSKQARGLPTSGNVCVLYL